MQDIPDDETGSWMPMPDAAHAAVHATPFPDFDAPDQEVRMAVYDLTVEQMCRLAEREREAINA